METKQMARVSRQYHKPVIEKKMKVALYARLSVGNKSYCSADGNTSIENQIDIMMNYLRGKEEFQFVKAYTDINYSGKDFARPGFQEMMQDIRDGVVNCVVVKDISRFGRNYIEVGNYLENIFAFLNVRFISVNDQIDSFDKGVTLSTQIKNILSDSQRKYISEATKSSLTARVRNGKLLLPNAPYGYSRESNGVFKVDEETANIVREIFLLATQGNSYAKIAKHLNDSAVSTRSGGNTMWAQSTIGQILKNRAYMGEGSCKIGNEKFTKQDAYPAILTKEEFEVAQHSGKHRKQHMSSKSAPLVGRVICFECGRSMVRSEHCNEGKSVATFQCRTSTVLSNTSCFKKAILESEIEEVLRQKVFYHTEELRKKQTMLNDSLIEKSNLLEKHKVEEGKSIDKLKTEFTDTYKKLHDGKMVKDEFEQYYSSYKEVIADLKSQMLQLDSEYKKLYEEYFETANKVKKLRQNLSTKNFVEHFLSENDVMVTISEMGDVLVESQRGCL
ncbi:MAG: recombinase family protein [Lachnospiraceae bacterium]